MRSPSTSSIQTKKGEMFLLRLLGRGIAHFHKSLNGDELSRLNSDATAELVTPPITANCLIAACPETEEMARDAFPCHNIVLCEGPKSLLEYLVRLEPRPLEILIASPTIQCALLSNIDDLRQLAMLCLRKLWVHSPHPWSAEQQLRVALHRVGYYEVAHCLVDKGILRFERSSVGLRPDGQFQVFDVLPGVAEGRSADWLLASRISLLTTDQLPWKWIYGEGMLTHDGYLSAANDKDPILSVTEMDIGATRSNGVRISASFRWQSPLTGPAVGSLVGCYYGPGDSNMYLAMLEPQTQTQLTVSLWRNVGSWEQISKTVINLPQAKCIQPNGQPKCEQVIEVTLEIMEDRLVLHCDAQVVLSVEDDSLPRNMCHGARILGSQLQIGQIEALLL